MRGIKQSLVGGVLSAVLLFSTRANAMQVPQFDKMGVKDRADYLTSLVWGASKALIAHGQPEQGQKVVEFFTHHDATNGATDQFFKNLQSVRILNARNAADPNSKQAPYEVEHALYITLKDNGIIVPVNVLLTINKDFKPSDPSSSPSSVTETNKPSTK